MGWGKVKQGAERFQNKNPGGVNQSDYFNK